ncbi:YciI family protein [Peribacillus castrilensis]|uniref:YCII-like protein n=1 Tax=Peribacillus simplex TaxID=1478 RepID=A0AAN2TTF4_9BACI|nr:MULTISPECIES: YciI family protein [Bacillaceae]ECO1677981.1 GTP cyclohydrolase [Listeria monocytogenes]MCF7621972.1 YciI family protein [Peribacillus frigoritolerans]MCP1156143.1 YciI family protein [Peribacillus frigoritolerans]MCT1390731.1 YciI family protein [Peribacillus frigoritolerans]PAL11311.1 GTP cyclohydrolase [Peribacillus simplex]
MFLVLVTYTKPLEEVDNSLEDHVMFLNKYYEQKKFVCSGRRNPRIGGVILANVNTSQEMEAIIQEDPFYFRKIAEYEVIEFLPTKFDEKFKVFIEDGEQA